jgi:hypothetical protein
VPDVAVERPRTRLPIWFLIALPLIAAVFAACCIHRGNRSSLRGDEINTLLQFWRVQSLGELVAKGAGTQVSPAPLMYLVDTLADRSRLRLNYLGLSPQGYVRLPSVIFTAALGFGAALVVALQVRKADATRLQYFLILCGLAIFCFHPKVFAFACTERPYGLWNGLWLFLLAWLLGRPPSPKVPLFLLSLLAATATAACFQILAVGIALVVVRAVERRPPKEVLKEGALLLALPALIGAYYALRSVTAPYEERTYAEKVPHFLRFWLWQNLHVWIAGGAMTALALKRPALRALALPPVALTALIVVMPLIFTLSHMKGYTMVSRQYIWTSTALPLACFFAAIAWPELKPTRYLRAVATVAALAIAAGNVYATFSRPPLRNDSRELALLDKGSALMTMLQEYRPGEIVAAPEMGEIERQNVALIEEWVNLRYVHVPLSNRVIRVKEVDGRLVAEEPTPK